MRNVSKVFSTKRKWESLELLSFRQISSLLCLASKNSGWLREITKAACSLLQLLVNRWQINNFKTFRFTSWCTPSSSKNKQSTLTWSHRLSATRWVHIFNVTKQSSWKSSGVVNRVNLKWLSEYFLVTPSIKTRSYALPKPSKDAIMKQFLLLRSAPSCNPIPIRWLTTSIVIATIFCFSDRRLSPAEVEHVGLAALLLAKPLTLSHPWVETLPWVILVIIIITNHHSFLQNCSLSNLSPFLTLGSIPGVLLVIIITHHFHYHLQN